MAGGQVTARDVRLFRRAVRAAERRGELTKQQSRTLRGQAANGDLKGALRGLERLYRG